MRTQFRTLKFSPATVGPVIDLMDRYRYTSDSIFWFNIEPDVDERSVHTGSIFWKAFSSRGPRIPQFTWTSATDRKGNFQPSEIGLTHPTGIAVLDRIKSFQINVPNEWQLIQDHPKRGIVFQLPETYDPEEVVVFATSVIPVVSPFEFEGSFKLIYSDLTPEQ
ncbi:MAG: hypothetical protein VX754_04325 [Actinomycetota bacterium]|nr:hypothetical protein [Actinomycetota bacterium]